MDITNRTLVLLNAFKKIEFVPRDESPVPKPVIFVVVVRKNQRTTAMFGIQKSTESLKSKGIDVSLTNAPQRVVKRDKVIYMCIVSQIDQTGISVSIPDEPAVMARIFLHVKNKRNQQLKN